VDELLVIVLHSHGAAMKRRTWRKNLAMSTLFHAVKKEGHIAQRKRLLEGSSSLEGFMPLMR
jgi:hypothetical protein